MRIRVSFSWQPVTRGSSLRRFARYAAALSAGTGYFLFGHRPKYVHRFEDCAAGHLIQKRNGGIGTKFTTARRVSCSQINPYVDPRERPIGIGLA